jgi:hypothetical protein
MFRLARKLFLVLVVFNTAMQYLFPMQEIETPTYKETADVISKAEEAIIKHESYAFATGFFSGMLQGLCVTHPEIRAEIIKITNLTISQVKSK